jgi:hypothetical protein
MSDDYRLRDDLQRIVANAGSAPHWNTASDKPVVPDRYTRAKVEAAVKRAIEASINRAEKYTECCQSCAGVGRVIRALATDPAALERIIKGAGNE